MLSSAKLIVSTGIPLSLPFQSRVVPDVCFFSLLSFSMGGHGYIMVEYWFVGRQTCKEQVYAVVVQSWPPPTIPLLFNDCGTALHCGFAPPLMPF